MTPKPQPSCEFTRVEKTLPPVDVDCSEWARTPGVRSSGQFIRVCQSLEPIEVNGIVPESVGLTLTLTLVERADAQEVLAKVTKLIDSLHEFAKSVGLTGLQWDKDQSKAFRGVIELVLVANNPVVASNGLRRLRVLVV